MSLMTSLLRMRAATTGNALRASRLRHLHLSDQPLMMLTLKRTGPAARPLAVMLGTDPHHPQLLVAPPSGSTTPMLAALADTVTAHIATRQQHTEHLPATDNKPARQRYADAPQILVPNPQTVRHLKALGDDLRFRTADDQMPGSRSVQRLGHWLTYLTDRADVPGSAALIPMTDFLGMHWITGQSPLEDKDLATLLAWIDPPRHAASGRDAAHQAEDPAIHRSAGPATDAAFDNDQLAPLFHAFARAEEGDRTRILHDLDRLLAAYLQPTWDRMWQAYTLLQALPEAHSTARRWDHERTAFSAECSHLLQDGRPRPAREQAVAAAVRLALRERAAAAFAAERAADDPFVRAELRTTGEAFGGTVTAIDPERIVHGPTGRARWRPRFTLSTTDPVHMEPGQLLASHLRRNARYRLCDITYEDDATLVELEITAGMGRVISPTHAVLPTDGDFLVLTQAPDHYQMPELPAREHTPWTHGGPPRDHTDDSGEDEAEQ
ncbi:hypothetical protein [Streptomyces sp. NBC_00063]|uniref:hypothetical protein n=1 Tax=Streptomyces sp. NBC_00063 TaxID=2975638 RepID=UPI0022591199|nr:hypothetical protein [Streptomyces sp. NBC_00063]MCX5443889.1 hypothetical protein [Streptomyces sp. NBC_00063]